MASASAGYIRKIGMEVEQLLGPDFQYLRSRREFRRATPEGHDVVVLSASSKWSPFINVSFYFGKQYKIVADLRRAVGLHPHMNHVQQFALHRQPLYAATYTGPDNWDVDLRNPPAGIAGQIADAIHGMAEPFFGRFSSIREARDAIAKDDPGCFGGRTFWRQLLLLDAALGDLDHFHTWSACLSEWDRKQADETVAQLQTVMSNVV
jgi:hypothetical protein